MGNEVNMSMLTKEQISAKLDLVVDRLLNLGGADYQNDKATEVESHVKGQVERDFGIEEWDWPQGVGLFGLANMQRTLRDNRFDKFFEEWFTRNFSVGLPSRNVNTTAPFLTLLDYANRTNNKKFKEECKIHAQWVMENLPRTHEHGFQHVTSAIGDRLAVRLNDGQLWIDTLFMAVLFLHAYGQQSGDRRCVEEAVQQILIHIKYLHERTNGLFHHGWSFIRKDNFGKVYWCRGNSWFTLGITEFLSQPEKYPLNEGVRRFFIDTYKSQVESLVRFQRQSGLWTTVLDDPSSYEEVSGSAGIAAGIYRGCKLGILDASYRDIADRAITGICKHISDDGTVGNVSAGTGIGLDSTFYQEILIRPMAYGQALVLIALVEALG